MKGLKFILLLVILIIISEAVFAANHYCGEGFVQDCSGDDDCCLEAWIGDGYPDCEDQLYNCDLTCYDNDGGDCDDYEIVEEDVDWENFCGGTGIPGDANQDSGIDVIDIVMIVNFILSDTEDKFTEDMFDCSDIESDDSLNVLDIVALMGMILSCGGNECEELEYITCPSDCNCADYFEVLPYNPDTLESCFYYDMGGDDIQEAYGYLYFSWKGGCYVETIDFPSPGQTYNPLEEDFEFFSPFNSQSFYDITDLPLIYSPMAELDMVTINFSDGSIGTVDDIQLQCGI